MAIPTRNNGVSADSLADSLAKYIAKGSHGVYGKFATGPRTYDDTFMKAMFEPRQGQYVRYDAKLNRTVFEDPDTFYLTGPESPSDSRWLVPGTENDEPKRYAPSDCKTTYQFAVRK